MMFRRMREPLRRRALHRLRAGGRVAGLQLLEGRLRLRWLRWRWGRRPDGAAAGGEPARGFRFAASWYAGYRRSRAGRREPMAASFTLVHRRLPAISLRINALDGETAATLRRGARERTPEAFVVRLPRARVLGDRGDVISSNGYWLPDLSLGDRSWVHRRHSFPDRAIPPSLTTLAGTALVLANQWAGVNYFHWTFNCLTRIHLCRMAGIDPAAVDHVVVNASRSPYRSETLERVAMPLGGLVECDETFHARADQVLATSSLWFAHMLPWVHEFLRETFLPAAAPSGGPERIWIRRGKTAWRPLVNEPDCLALLEQHGFVPVQLAGLAVADQAALFAGARYVAAPHDAGLTNLVFCRPGTTVLELLSPGHPRAYFAEVCAIRELEYFCLFGEPEPQASAGRLAYRVPVESLARLIEAAGL
jgi:hypothetical protein